MARCSSCPRVRPPVPSTGPTPSRLMFLGEAPSREEDRHGMPFCGPTGLELSQLYFPILNLTRDDFHITNARMCSHWDYHNPTPQEAADCMATHLGPLLAQVRPQIVIPMGAVACSLWPAIRLGLHHGVPQVERWGAWEGVLFPMYHPSAGMKPGGGGYMISMTNDFNELRKLLGVLDENGLGIEQT